MMWNGRKQVGGVASNILGFNEEASVSEVIFRVMQGHVKKDMSPKENALYEKVIEKAQYCLPIYHIIRLPWSILDSLGLVTSNTVQCRIPMYLFVTFVTDRN